MIIKRFYGNPRCLQAIIRAWIAESNCQQMDIDLDESVYYGDLEKLIINTDSDLLVLQNDDGIIGFMGLRVFNSPLGRQKIANEHYWYVLPRYRGMASLRFIKAAQKWAKEKDCSHLMMNASAMASGLHDKVCRVYELFNMKKFETTYLWGVK